MLLVNMEPTLCLVLRVAMSCLLDSYPIPPSLYSNFGGSSRRGSSSIKAQRREAHQAKIKRVAAAIAQKAWPIQKRIILKNLKSQTVTPEQQYDSYQHEKQDFTINKIVVLRAGNGRCAKLEYGVITDVMPDAEHLEVTLLPIIQTLLKNQQQPLNSALSSMQKTCTEIKVDTNAIETSLSASSAMDNKTLLSLPVKWEKELVMWDENIKQFRPRVKPETNMLYRFIHLYDCQSDAKLIQITHHE
jgi:hypothetical protein